MSGKIFSATVARIVMSLTFISFTGETPAAEASGSPGRAPAFELPAVDGSGTVLSAELFSSNEYTFLLFWEGGCPQCVEALSRASDFDGEFGGAGVGVTGVNCGNEDLLAVKGLVRGSGARFLQLLDRGGRVAGRYMVPHSVFTIVLVDNRGIIVARAEDPQEDVSRVMQEMLEGGGGYRHDTAVGETGDDAIIVGMRGDATAAKVNDEAKPGDPLIPAGIHVRGDARIRFLSISARGDGASGPYGETVSSGNRMTGRFELEVSGKAARGLEAGGLLRIGNEGLNALRAGPDYFDSQYGSVFAAVEAGRFHVRFGYYSISMTPLTLMRWDWEDNPRTGGYAGCGCGTAAGVLLVESLEQLGPDLRFEGCVARYDLEDMYVRAFYAMPRRARGIPRVETEFGGEEHAAYSLEVAGLETKWQGYLPRFERFARAGAHLAVSWEDPGSVNPIEFGYDHPFEWYRATVLSLTGEIPVARRAVIRGEWIALGRTEFHDPARGAEGDEENRGNGGFAGVVIDHGNRFLAACDYIEIGKGFHSPFAAISYQPGRRGARFSSRLSYPDERAALSIFYKRLRETGPEGPGFQKQESSAAGVSIDVDLDNGLGAGLAYIDEGNWRDGETGRFDATRRSFTAGCRYRFDRVSYIHGQYQRIDNSGDSSGAELESVTEMFSVYLGAVF